MSSDERLRTAIEELEPSTTRRTLVESATLAGVGGVSGCLDSAETDQSTATQPAEQTDGPGTVVPGADILMTTDGERVYAVENRKSISGETATDAGQVIADGEDTGAVLQTVLDGIGAPGKPAGNPIDPENPPGRHVHFGRGRFRWDSQAVTNGANEIRITGNWWGTDWVATSSIESFVDFSNPDFMKSHHVGPQIGYLLAHGEGNADHLFTLGPHTDDTMMQSITCFGTNESMIHAQASTGEDREFNDTTWLYNLRVLFGGALAIIEEGTDGIPAAFRVQDCFCAYPNTYGLIFRNGQRLMVDNFFTGVRSVDGDPGDGGILIENPPTRDRNQAPLQQCHLHMPEIEAPNNRDAVPVHIRAPEGATNPNRNHRVVFPRGGHSYKLLTVEAAEPGGVENVELLGTQLGPNRPDAVELINARDCRIEFQNGPNDPRELVTIEGGARNTVNGVGRSAGSPGQDPAWSASPWEGVSVWDTENDQLYEYVAGSWRQTT